jgi:hypothetical protein
VVVAAAETKFYFLIRLLIEIRLIFLAFFVNLSYELLLLIVAYVRLKVTYCNGRFSLMTMGYISPFSLERVYTRFKRSLLPGVEIVEGFVYRFAYEYILV